MTDEYAASYYKHQEAERQAEQERAAREQATLEAVRQERLAREAYQGLTEEERKRLAEQTDPARMARELVESVRRESLEAFERENAAQRERELMEWRAKHPHVSDLERHTAIRQANANAQQRKEAFFENRRARELAAEKNPDEISRLVATLSPQEAEQVETRLGRQPTVTERIQGIKAESQRASAQDKQSQLLEAYRREIDGKRGTAAMIVRKKYRNLGLSI